MNKEKLGSEASITENLSSEWVVRELVSYPNGFSAHQRESAGTKNTRRH